MSRVLPLQKENVDQLPGPHGRWKMNDGRRRTSMKGKQPSASGRHVHLLQFDVNSEVSIVERDCICLFWNKIDYKF